MSDRNGKGSGRARRRSIAAGILALAAAGLALPLHADDSGAQSGDASPQQILDLLKQLQSLQSANGAQPVMQDGFAAGETFSTLAGQPEVAAGLKLLQGVLDFSAGFSSSSSSAATQALTTLTKNVAEMQAQVANLQNAVDVLSEDIKSDHNQAIKTALLYAQQYFSDRKDELFPASTVAGGPAVTTQRRLDGSSVGKPVDPETASTKAHELEGELDLFIKNEPQYFLGDDVQLVAGQKLPASGLKPYPALSTYLLGLQLWITASEIASGGTDAGHARIQRDPKVQAWLAKHIAFLRSRANGGADPNGNPLQDQIVAAEHCVWNVNGTYGSSTASPDGQGMCSAFLSCRDDIARTIPKIPAVAISWKQDRGAVCQLDPNGQALSGGGVPSDRLAPVELALQQQYGLLAMDRMAAMLARVAQYGTAVQGAPLAQAGNFGGKADAPFFVYAADGAGVIKRYVGYRNQPLPQATAAGNIANLTALIPGGGTTFYALTKDGKLDWYQFTGSNGSRPFNGPVTVGSGFGAYKQIFGGGDGVIYAIRNDGTLLWFRHAGFANGGGAATMSGPKAVASGFGQFRSVFSAGDGIIYAIAEDGSLLWYRHMNFRTGVPDPAHAKSMPNTKPVAQRFGQDFAGPTQLEGPIKVGSGWGAFRRVIPAGDGAVLAVQTDGKLLWYRHDDYRTGVSSEASSNGSMQTSGVRPTAWEMQAAAAASHEVSPGANPANRGSSLASSWGAPAQAAGKPGAAPVQRSALGAPQWGTQLQPHTVVGAAVTSSSLHGGSESLQRLHPVATRQAVDNPGSEFGARQNIGATTVLGAAGGTPHWEGPATIDAHSGWDGFPEIAASLPITVQSNNIK